MKLSIDNSLKVEVDIMLAAAIQLKNIIIDSWIIPLDFEPDEKYDLINEEDKEFIRTNILNSISTITLKPILLQFEECFSNIASKDFPEGWPILIAQIDNGLKGAKEPLQFRALLISLKILNKISRYKINAE